MVPTAIILYWICWIILALPPEASGGCVTSAKGSTEESQTYRFSNATYYVSQNTTYTYNAAKSECVNNFGVGNPQHHLATVSNDLEYARLQEVYQGMFCYM